MNDEKLLRTSDLFSCLKLCNNNYSKLVIFHIITIMWLFYFSTATIRAFEFVCDALLADPAILILDEATSSIDTETEIMLQKGLERLLEGRTSFIIAHRLSTIKNSSRIMYIANRGIAECGSHDELIAKQGKYYELYMAQYKFLEQL